MSAQEIATAVVSVGECRLKDIRVGELRRKSYGGWFVRVSCPMLTGYRILDLGRLRVGWVFANVRAVSSPRTWRYRCLRTGHTRPFCRDKIDRSARCFNCGNNDHIAARCKAEPKCPLCIDTEEKVDHWLGDEGCVCPSFPAEAIADGNGLSRKLSFRDNDSERRGSDLC